MSKRHIVILLAVVAFGVFPARAGADHVGVVAGVAIASGDPGDTKSFPDCLMRHYHGLLWVFDEALGHDVLRGAPDTNCGWGKITPAVHLSGEYVPAWPGSDPWTSTEWCTSGEDDSVLSAQIATSQQAVSSTAPGAEPTTVAQEVPQEEQRGLCDRFLDFFRDRPEPTDWADAAFQGVSGGFSPKTVALATDIIVEAAPSIKAKMDNINQYEQVYGPLIRTTPKPVALTWSQRFWRWAASQVPFWD